jgi:hypothetical protein
VSGGTAAPLLGAVMRSPMVRDLTRRLIAYVIALVLLGTAFGFLVAALYLSLLEVVEAPLAALLAALVLGGVASLIVLNLRYRRPRPAAAAPGVDALLLSASDQVRRHPWSSLAIAALLGALAEVTQTSASTRPPPA